MPLDRRPIRIVTDSAADLPADIVGRLEITVVPLLISVGQETFADQQLSSHEFWRRVHGAFWPKTSQPPIGAFIQAFERLTEQGYDVICVTFTAAHSGTFNSAWSAASRFGDRVTVVDSRSISLAEGWQVLRAAELALQGASRDDILAAIASLRDRTRIYVQLDSLEAMRRGGRAALLMPTIDRVMRTLNLKALINVVDGELKLMGVARSYQKGLERLKQEMQRIAPLERLAVLHTRRAQVAAQLADELAALVGLPREQIMVRETGAVLSCHAGAGVSAVFGLSKGKVRGSARLLPGILVPVRQPAIWALEQA